MEELIAETNPIDPTIRDGETHSADISEAKKYPELKI